MILKFEARLNQTCVPYRKVLHNQPLDFPLHGVRGLVLSGGPGNPHGPLSLAADYIALNRLDVPTIGFCLGHEIVAAFYGGQIGELGFRRDGLETVSIDDSTDELLCGLPQHIELVKQHVFMVTEIGSDMRALAHSDTCEFEIIRHRDRPTYGLQSHPEASVGPGEIIVANFLAMCGY